MYQNTKQRTVTPIKKAVETFMKKQFSHYWEQRWFLEPFVEARFCENGHFFIFSK